MVTLKDRKRGKMATIRKRKSGKWQVIIRKKNYPSIVRTFLEKGTASKYARDIETQMDKKIFEDLSGAEGTTLKQLIIKYRDEIVPEYKSAKTLTYKLNYMLKFKICYYNLLQLNSAHIHKFKKEISVGRAPKTVNMYIQTLQTVWNMARKQWGVTLPAQSPFALVTYNRITNERDAALTDEEFKRLLEEAAKTKLNVLPDMIQFAAITAARYSEITGLLRANTDFAKRTATFIDTKNGDDRTIPLHDDALAILRRYPFGEKFFNVKTREVFRNYFDRARRAAGVSHYRFHDLRSRAINSMLLSGMSEIEVAQVSGHKTLSILHKRYSRIKPTQLLDKINNVVNFK